MNDENAEASFESSVNAGAQSSNSERDSHSSAKQSTSGETRAQEAVVLVRGEAIHDQGGKSQSQGSHAEPASHDNKESVPKPKSAAKVDMQTRLPALDDDAQVGVSKDQVVTRDGKADLAFAGTMLASAAPTAAPKGKWQEYRVYQTSGGKHVFSKISRSVYAEDPDAHEAEVFDPAPSSMPSALLRSARDLTRSRPMTWEDAAASFFGYDPLAKALYRKLGGQFEEHIS